MAQARRYLHSPRVVPKIWLHHPKIVTRKRYSIQSKMTAYLVPLLYRYYVGQI